MQRIRTFIAIVFCLMLSLYGAAQKNPYWQEPGREQVDSLQKILPATTNDSVAMYINRQLGLYYQEINRATALGYYKQMLKLARKTKQKLWEAEALSRNGYVSCLLQNYSGGLKFLLTAKELASQAKYEKDMWNPGYYSTQNSAHVVRLTILGDINTHLGLVHLFTGEYAKALQFYITAENITNEVNDYALESLLYLNKGEAYMGLSQQDSAEAAFHKSIFYSDRSGYKKYKGLTLYDLGKIYETRGKVDEAKKYYRLSIETNKETESPDFEGMGFQALADISRTERTNDSALFFSRQALLIYQNINDTLGLIAAHSSMSSALDALGKTDSAYKYLKRATILKDALNKEGRIKSFQLAGFNEQLKLEEQKAEQLRTITKIRTYSFLAGIVVLILVGAIFYRSYRRQQKDKITIENAFTNLKSTQSQLIQSEKMASLGELTAGIAHEIQNPLNFVNNFSEVNQEMIEELQTELLSGNTEEAIAIAKDIKTNEEKINHHGKRADAIVKGMLQHSQRSEGKKETTDINALCDEYLRLSYHGMRAKDKSFNADFKKDFDNSIGKINLIPQDIGRVLLNLFNNAFYAVNEKKKTADETYMPAITVGTKNSLSTRGEGRGEVLIFVTDNGNGIPQTIIDKIFQPFFTTKPTGQGTGLGLSLSYDIIIAHGGEIKVETKENEGTEFIIQLPN